MKISRVILLIGSLIAISSLYELKATDDQKQTALSNISENGKMSDAPYIKGYPELEGNTIKCYLLSPGICIAIIRAKTEELPGHYEVPLPSGTVDFYGELVHIGTVGDYASYEVR